ncbi:hypothetical protein [Castellaniella sp.]|uniref:hypothetical protein n=1 Tax=Castellaniella sp. TaxID=1955812 RepID=UPI002AFF040F|nr:hypothetical protein [Castellaniella sp.]
MSSNHHGSVAAYVTPVVAPVVALYLVSHNIPLGSIERPMGFALGGAVCAVQGCAALGADLARWPDAQTATGGVSHG